jgi:hypothetical protein
MLGRHCPAGQSNEHSTAREECSWKIHEGRNAGLSLWPQTHSQLTDLEIMAEFEEMEASPSDFNDFEEEQVAELEDTDDWGE